MSAMEHIDRPITRAKLKGLAALGFGDMIKAVVDCRRRTMVVGGELHADEEQWLIDHGSEPSDLWGINLYPEELSADWIEFDSMINVRPARGNRSRGVESAELREAIRSVVEELIRS
jgi:hypothetical protein